MEGTGGDGAEGLKITRYCLGFIFVPENTHVVLVRKNRPKWQMGLLNGVGGHCNPGESFADAMLREGREEMSMEMEWELVGVLSGTNHRGHERYEMGVFRTTMFSRTIIGQRNDVGEKFEEVAVDDIVMGNANVIPNLTWLVPLALGKDRAFWPYMIEERAGVGG